MRADAPAYRMRCTHLCVRDNREHAHFHGPDVIRILKAHIPSLTNEDEREINDKVAMFAACIFTGEPGEPDVADLAVRTCSCGAHIDGFYDYVDHLIAVFGGEKPED